MSDIKIHCSFCGLRQDFVDKIIQGPGVTICNYCVGLCANLLIDSGTKFFRKDPLAAAIRENNAKSKDY